MNREEMVKDAEVFSLVVLCYNNAELLPQCLDSILQQDYPGIEIIVADDKSASFDVGAVEAYIAEHQASNVIGIKVYQNPENLGTVANINTALQHVHGKYVKIIAADDALYDENVLKNAAEALEKSPDGIVTGDVMKCDADLKNPQKYPDKLQHLLNQLSAKEVFKRLCVHNDIIAGGVFFEQRFFEKYGTFNESYRLMEDWPLWLHATSLGCRIAYAPFFTICYRSNGGIGTSVNPIYMADKKRVLQEIIIPAKKELGTTYYLKARLSFKIINSPTVRRVYGKLFRKGK